MLTHFEQRDESKVEVKGRCGRKGGREGERAGGRASLYFCQTTPCTGTRLSQISPKDETEDEYEVDAISKESKSSC